MTNPFPHRMVKSEGRQTLTVFNEAAEQPIYVATDAHPNWFAICSGVGRGDPNVWDLFDVAKGVMARFNEITDRVSYNGSDVLFDGDPIHSVLSDQLLRAIEDGNADNYTALAKFWEKLESNPNEHSREQAYDFLSAHAFQITPEGDVVGFKGVTKTYDAEDGSEVFHSGWASKVSGLPSAYVNGNPIPEKSKVPQTIGDVVSMPRSEVVHDPSEACSRGLHVSTQGYAKSYGTVMEVHVNPRDIVSVPTDGGGEKVRVCRYKIARLAETSYDNAPVLRPGNSWAGDVGYKV